MKILNNSINLFRNTASGLKIFLIIYLSFQLFPIYGLTGSTIQPLIGEFQFKYINSNIRRIVVTLLFILAFLINDPMLVALISVFILLDTKINYKQE